MGKRFNLKPAVADRVEFNHVGESESTYVAGLKPPGPCVGNRGLRMSYYVLRRVGSLETWDWEHAC